MQRESPFNVRISKSMMAQSNESAGEIVDEEIGEEEEADFAVGAMYHMTRHNQPGNNKRSGNSDSNKHLKPPTMRIVSKR